MEPATRRTYAGALNNRIDRNEAVGSRFRVEGMRDHVLSSDCYVEEETVIERHKGAVLPHSDARLCREGCERRAF